MPGTDVDVPSPNDQPDEATADQVSVAVTVNDWVEPTYVVAGTAAAAMEGPVASRPVTSSTSWPSTYRDHTATPFP